MKDGEERRTVTRTLSAVSAVGLTVLGVRKLQQGELVAGAFSLLGAMGASALTQYLAPNKQGDAS